MPTTTIAVILLLLHAVAVAAQQPATVGVRRSNTSKLFLEAAANRSAIALTDQREETESGSGMTFKLGYGFSPHIALMLEGNAAFLNHAATYVLSQGDLGVRYHFAAPTRAVVPFVEVALTVFSTVQENVEIVDDDGEPLGGDLEIAGTGVSFGAGVLYFVSPKWALSAGVKLTSGNFSDVTFQNVTVSGFHQQATTSRVNLGVAWFPTHAR